MKYVVLLIVVVGLLNAEQSVYSDSDFVDSTTIAKKNSREIFILKQKINQLKERIEGLKSLLNSQANEIAALKQKANNSNLETIVNQLSKRVAKLESMPTQPLKLKEETQKQDVSLKVKDEPIKQEETKKKLSNKELYKESVLNFTKNRLTKAEHGFKTLLNKGYKKASVNFYLGEISFKKRRFKDAIDYYQKSATLNDSASYMDKLLLHTAIALKKKGKLKEAKIFFEAVVNGYPDTKSAKEAKKYLK